MKRILLTIGHKEDLMNFEECVNTQNEWAVKNNIEHIIIELEESENLSWGFYKTFISYFLNNEDKLITAILPHVMILETFNPLFLMENGIATNIGETSFLTGKFNGSLMIRMILEKSISFNEIKNVSCNLALEIISIKAKNLIYFIDGLVAKPDYPRLIEELDQNRTGFEIHANTDKNNEFKISYNKINNQQIYQGGEFAINLNLDNLELSKGFIFEFKKIKDKILETRNALEQIRKDINQ